MFNGFILIAELFKVSSTDLTDHAILRTSNCKTICGVQLPSAAKLVLRYYLSARSLALVSFEVDRINENMLNKANFVTKTLSFNVAKNWFIYLI